MVLTVARASASLSRTSQASGPSNRRYSTLSAARRPEKLVSINTSHAVRRAKSAVLLTKDEVAHSRLQLPVGEGGLGISLVVGGSLRLVCSFLRNFSSALKLTGLVMKWSIPEFQASSFALADAKPVKAMIQHRGMLYSRSYCRMVLVAVIPSITGIDISIRRCQFTVIVCSKRQLTH